MPAQIDPDTDIGKVRLLISHVDQSALIFTDQEINGFLTLEGGVKLAAAQALDTIASNEALLFKKVRAGRLMETDGPAVAKALRDHAEALRGQTYEDGSFEISDGYQPSNCFDGLL